MKTEDLIPDEFFKQFKKGEELQNFLESIQKRSIEKVLSLWLGKSESSVFWMSVLIDLKARRTENA